MSINFSIRKATKKDYSGMEALFAEIDTHHREALPQVFRKPGGPARTKDFLYAVLADRESVIFIAESDDRIIGLVYACIRKYPDTPIRVPYRTGEIDQLIVNKKYRRYGIGKALMEKAEQWASEMKLDRLELSVWDFNQSARFFYQDLGYAPVFHRMWKILKGPF
jgi:GNAT superfamily N-acetyltransferase